jgi:hypothetical protein
MRPLTDSPITQLYQQHSVMVCGPAQELDRVPLRDALEEERTPWRNGATVRYDCRSVRGMR